MSLLLKVIACVQSAILSSACWATICQRQENVMGPITARITAISPRMSEEELETAVAAAFAEIHKVDRLMSKYKKDSDVSRVNAGDAGLWIKVHPMTFAVLEETKRISELTCGAFDPTALPLSTVWGFWPEREPEVPSDEEIKNALSHVGHNKLSLNRKNHSLMKSDPDTKVDLAGIAKGYAVDRAMAALKKSGVKDALVEVGGETRVTGKNTKGKLWRIGVLHPVKREYLTVLELTDHAVATSGDYMNFFVVEGKRYCHLIDPRTGRPVSTGVCSVTVMAENCTQADAFATAISVLGAEDGLKLIESLRCTEAIVATRLREKRGIEVRVSSGLKELTISP